MNLSDSRAATRIAFFDHAGWALAMTVTGDGTLIDRRRVELVESHLPAMPHHHEAQRLPLADGVALVERVRRSADRSAANALAELDARSGGMVAGISVRRAVPLPATIEERIKNYRAMCVADWVMYRECLRDAASARGWTLHEFDAASVLDEAAAAFGPTLLAARIAAAGRAWGSPWRKEHRITFAAAMLAHRP